MLHEQHALKNRYLEPWRESLQLSYSLGETILDQLSPAAVVHVSNGSMSLMADATANVAGGDDLMDPLEPHLGDSWQVHQQHLAAPHLWTLREHVISAAWTPALRIF